MRLPSYLFLLCLFACHHLPAAARLERRQEVPLVPFPDPSGYDVQPVAIGVADTGYSGFPNVLNADIVLDFELKVAPGASIVRLVQSICFEDDS